MAFAQSTAVRKVRPAELARELNVQRQSIHELLQRGIISADGEGLIDVELARVAIANRVRPSGKTAQAVTTPEPAPVLAAPAPDAAAPVSSFHVAKTLRETAEARLAQLKLAEMEGRLLDRVTVERQAEKVAASLVQQLSAIPDRISAEFGADDGQRRALRQRLREELDHVRQEIADLASGGATHA